MNKNSWCLGNCEEIKRLNNTIDTLSDEIKELKYVKIAFLLSINDLLPDINCNKCKYRNEEYCEDENCHSAIYHYFLNKAKE